MIPGTEGAETPVPIIQPCSVRKVGFRLIDAPRIAKGSTVVEVTLLRK
jgi:hypothetical protein